MSPAPAHLGDALQDLLDRRLDADAQARAEAHLAGCAVCRHELEALRLVKQAASRRAGALPVPPQLAAAIAAALDREGGAVAHTPRRRLSSRPAVALGLLVLVALALASVLWQARTRRGTPAAVVRAYSDYRAGRLPLELRTTDPLRLQQFFAANGIPFETRVYDLGMMGFRLAGGRVHVIDGRTSALFIYEGPDGSLLLCDMYRGRLSELSATADVRERDGIRFQVYRQNGLTMVFWEEGDVVCVLASEMPPEDVVQLAFAKAMKPPPGSGT